MAGEQLSTLAFNTNWGTAHPPASSWPSAWRTSRPAASTASSSPSGGSESVEAAWKIVRQYHLANGQPQRTKAIARNIAYHGVTLGALAFTGVPGFKEPFGRPAIDTTHVSNTNAFRSPLHGEELTRRAAGRDGAGDPRRRPREVALIIAEPVQNAGGCLSPPPGYWQGLRELADRYGSCSWPTRSSPAAGGSASGSARREGVVPGPRHHRQGPDLGLRADGRRVVSDRVVAPLFEAGAAPPRHHLRRAPAVAAAIALKNIEIFERDGVLENVRALEPHLERAARHASASCRSSATCAAPGSSGPSSWSRATSNERLDADERERLLRGFLPRPAARGRAHRARRRPRRRGPADRPAADQRRAVLDEIVDAMRDVLTDAGHELRVESRGGLNQLSQ